MQNNSTNILVGYIGGISQGVTVGKPYLIGKSLKFRDDIGEIRDSALFAWNITPVLESMNDSLPKPELLPSQKQVGGDHYIKMGLQPLEATYLTYGYLGMKAAVFTKVLKYINRDKDDEEEQISKAIHCLELLKEKAVLENDRNN